MTVIYLAHSVHERQEGKRLQKELEGLGYIVINPFYPETPRPDIEALDQLEIKPWDVTPEKGIEIVKQDLRAVRLSDMVVAKLPERRKTFGIPCEIMYAWMLHIPVYTVTISMLKHPWVITLSEKVYSTFDELYEYLKGVST